MLRRTSRDLPAAFAVVALCMFAAVAVARRLGGEKAVPAIPRITLNNGVQMPMLSLGIWQFSNDEVATAVKQALSVGIDHFDASIFYGTPENDGQPNQPALGRALAGIPRSQYFLLTKIDPSYMDSDEYSIVTEKFTRSNAYYRTLEQAAHNLGDLGLEYVDVMLVHWSMSDCVVMQETWRAMEEVHRLGWGQGDWCLKLLPEHSAVHSIESEDRARDQPGAVSRRHGGAHCAAQRVFWASRHQGAGLLAAGQRRQTP